MLKNPSKKYRPFPPIELKDRRWPNETLTHAPRWCSVDLRDGNQALAVPMNVSQKLELFQTLVKIGFKEIEVGFPSASNTEFAFNRLLIEKGHAPDDVWLDRKSTRLNSSHLVISYAVFCLKKKKQITI